MSTDCPRTFPGRRFLGTNLLGCYQVRLRRRALAIYTLVTPRQGLRNSRIQIDIPANIFWNSQRPSSRASAHTKGKPRTSSWHRDRYLVFALTSEEPSQLPCLKRGVESQGVCSARRADRLKFERGPLACGHPLVRKCGLGREICWLNPLGSA